MPDARKEQLTPKLAEELVKILSSRGKTIAIAESCTAGLVSDFLARVPGASKVLWGSFVTYTADAKTKMLRVPDALIKAHGEVSRPTALAMAKGALKKSRANMAFSVTGYAGPGGSENQPGNPHNVPTGVVWIGSAYREDSPPNRLRAEAKMFTFVGSRNEVRRAAAAAVLEEIFQKVNGDISTCR